MACRQQALVTRSFGVALPNSLGRKDWKDVDACVDTVWANGKKIARAERFVAVGAADLGRRAVQALQLDGLSSPPRHAHLNTTPTPLRSAA